MPAAGKVRRQRTLGGEDDADRLFCVCQQPYDPDNNMLQCDGCSEWYHTKCVGVSLAQAKTIKKWSCPVCCAIKNDTDVLDSALARWVAGGAVLLRLSEKGMTQLGMLSVIA